VIILWFRSLFGQSPFVVIRELHQCNNLLIYCNVMGIDCSSREFLKICIIHTWKVLNGKQQKKITKGMFFRELISQPQFRQKYSKNSIHIAKLKTRKSFCINSGTKLKTMNPPADHASQVTRYLYHTLKKRFLMSGGRGSSVFF